MDSSTKVRLAPNYRDRVLTRKFNSNYYTLLNLTTTLKKLSQQIAHACTFDDPGGMKDLVVHADGVSLKDLDSIVEKNLKVIDLKNSAWEFEKAVNSMNEPTPLVAEVNHFVKKQLRLSLVRTVNLLMDLAPVGYSLDLENRAISFTKKN